MVRDTNGVSLKTIEDHPLRKNSLRPNLTTICYLEVISGNHRLNPDKDSLRTGTLQMLPIVFHNKYTLSYHNMSLTNIFLVWQKEIIPDILQQSNPFLVRKKGDRMYYRESANSPELLHTSH